MVSASRPNNGARVLGKLESNSQSCTIHLQPVFPVYCVLIKPTRLSGTLTIFQRKKVSTWSCIIAKIKEEMGVIQVCKMALSSPIMDPPTLATDNNKRLHFSWSSSIYKTKMHNTLKHTHTNTQTYKHTHTIQIHTQLLL